MNKPLLILLVVFGAILSPSISIKIANSEPVKEVSYLKVFTSTRLIYDDGFYRIQYAPFLVLNENREIILKVGSSLDEPATIALNSGTYYIVGNTSSSLPPDSGVKVTVTHTTVKVVYLD